MGIPSDRANSAIRLSFSYSNSMEEVKSALKRIEETIDLLRKVMN